MLNSCGFQPLYRQDPVETPLELQAVKIDVIADRNGQQLRNFLIDTMTASGEPAPKKYRLQITLKETKRQVGFRKDLTPRHTEIFITASLTLSATPGGELLLSDEMRAIASYSLGAQSSFGAFSAETSEKSARANALKSLADDIKLRIVAFLVGYNTQNEG